MAVPDPQNAPLDPRGGAPTPALRLDENDPTTRAFLEGLTALQYSMSALVEENKNVLKAMGQPYAPNVSGASAPPRNQQQQQLFPPPGKERQGTLFDPTAVDPGAYTQPSASPPPPDVHQSASTPTRARRALGSIYRGANKVISTFGDTGAPQSAVAEELAAEGLTGGGGHSGGGASAPPRSGSDAAWYRMLQGRSGEAITLPRYGEFTSQDVLNLGAHAAAKFAVPGDGSAPGDAQRVIGTAGGLLGTMASMTPYFHVLESKTGMALGSRAMQAQSENMGYSRGGRDLGIGPFGMSIPGSQYFGAAGKESIKEDWASFKSGLGAGISAKEAKEFMDALRAEGYTSKNGLLSMTKVITDLKADKMTSGDVGSAGVMASVTDQMTRFGTNSVVGLSNSIKGMGEVAIKARMSVDEVYNALDQFANDQQQKGATYTEGFNTGKQFMNTTGLSAGILSQFQDNGTVQGMFSAGTGLLPSEMGASPLGSQMDAIYKSMDLLGGAYGGLGTRTVKSPYGNVAVTGKDQANALTAQTLGTTPDVIKQLQRDRKRNTAGGWLSTFTDLYDSEADNIKSNYDDRTGDPTGAAKALNAGRLTMNGQPVPGMDKLNKMMTDAGFSKDQIKKIDGSHTWDRADMINKVLAGKQNKEPTVTINLAPELRGKFGLTTPTQRKQANQAKVPTNGIFGSSDGYTPMLPHH